MRAIVIVISLLGLPLPLRAAVYQSFSNVVTQVMPSVVNIRTKENISSQRTSSSPYDYYMSQRNRVSKTLSLGSGVILNKSGFIVTNAHVLAGATEIDVLLNDKSIHKAKVVGIDKKTDIALLKIKVPQKTLKPISWANSDKLQIGDIVLAFGNPFGFSNTVTSGIISAKGRVLGNGPYDAFLQTDASINPGNSGGPLVDIRGRVVGINTAISKKGHNIGFAIPSNMVIDIISELKSKGKVTRPWLGIVGKNILSNRDMGVNFDYNLHGVIIENLIIDGPAYTAGLSIGDLIVEINEKKISDTHQLQRIVSKSKPSRRCDCTSLSERERLYES